MKKKDSNHRPSHTQQQSPYRPPPNDASYDVYDLQDISDILDDDGDDEEEVEEESSSHGGDHYFANPDHSFNKNYSHHRRRDAAAAAAAAAAVDHRGKHRYHEEHEKGRDRRHRLQASSSCEEQDSSPPRGRMNRSPGKKTASAAAAAAAVVSPAKTEPESDSEFDADDASAVSSAASSSSSSNGDDDDDDDEDTAGTGTTTDDEEGYSVISKDTTNDNGKGRHHLGGGSSSVISSETKSHKRLLRRLQSDDPSLTSLTVDQTLLEHSSIAEIAKVLAVNTTVVQLALDLPRGFKKQHILALLNALECNDTIASLSLRNVSICRHVATSVATFFSKTPTLIKLQLKQCPFMESGLAILFLGMQHCSTLSSLSMNGCNLGGYAADIVAATVPLLELSSLQLQQTSLSLPGFEFLLQNMERTGQKMQYLDLSSNDIVGTPEGMQLLVDALESIKLQRLVLQDCGLNRSTIKTLCLEGLLTQQANSKLTHLDVSHNRDLDDRAARYLVKLLETNTKLVELHIEGCSKISKEFRLDLSDKLRYNNSFLKAIGFSSDVSLAILDSMKLLGNMTK